LTCFGVVLFAWCTFAVYRWASMGARHELFHNPPKYPWPAGSAPPAIVTSSREGCLAIGSSVKHTEHKSDWGDYIDAAEDESCQATVGFLIAQAIMYCKTEELPGLKGHYTHYNDEDGIQEKHVLFFTLTLIVLIAIFGIILWVRSKKHDGGRPGKIAQRTVAMSITWIGYRASCWNTRSMFENNRPLALIVSAFIVSLSCFVILILFDRVLDKTLGRSSTPTWGSDGAGDTIPLAEKAMRGINICMGLVMALAWETNVETSVMTVVRSQEFMANHMVLSQSLISILLGVAMLFPWRRTLLPKSEMRETTFEHEIKHELLQLDKAENFMP